MWVLLKKKWLVMHKLIAVDTQVSLLTNKIGLKKSLSCMKLYEYDMNAQESRECRHVRLATPQ